MAHLFSESSQKNGFGSPDVENLLSRYLKSNIFSIKKDAKNQTK